MKKLLIATTVALTLSACSMRGVDQPLEVWKNYESARISASSLKEGEALAVFYRLNDVKGPATNIYVNGDYQTSLLTNSFSPVAVCASNSLFSGSFVNNQQGGNRTHGMQYSLSANDVAYIRVTEGKNGQLQFTQVDKTVAEKEVAHLQKASQTLPRTKVSCHQGAKVLDKIALSAGALFALNKSGYKDISLAGRKEIADFASKLNAIDASKIARVEVAGYTDPEGSKAYNQRLSKQRAESVKLALQKANVKHNIEAVGYGATNFVVEQCHTIKNKSERSVCNLPNRRVEITVFGK